mmetsp:Transcript_35272/g.80586  ORF Transcript_35272/g.80586 Transcript_35272/m.80586 type:complete len:202 (-) Transcript_35272:138-743(-)
MAAALSGVARILALFALGQRLVAGANGRCKRVHDVRGVVSKVCVGAVLEQERHLVGRDRCLTSVEPDAETRHRVQPDMLMESVHVMPQGRILAAERPSPFAGEGQTLKPNVVWEALFPRGDIIHVQEGGERPKGAVTLGLILTKGKVNVKTVTLRSSVELAGFATSWVLLAPGWRLGSVWEEKGEVVEKRKQVIVRKRSPS